MLEVVGVTKRFGGRVAVDGLSMVARPGQATGLLGRNGAGKTTTMRLILGILAPDAGEIRYDGRPAGARVRRRFGYLPEERGLYPRAPVGEQLVYLGRLAGLSGADARRRTAAVATELELDELLTRAPEELSRGNAQKAQLAAALAHDPELLVLDEPFAGLDPINARRLDDVLRRRLEAGVAVVYSSHQLRQVEDLCAQVTIVDRGRVVLAGRLDELRRGAPGARVVIAGPGAGAFADGLGGARTITRSDGRVRLALEPGDDPARIMALAAAAGPVRSFVVESVTLEELFVDAVGAPPQEPVGAPA